ncbi:hypothetical protein [Methylohalobius crimeensis]|uniref:hypothetical protein n=1 Tax=Methylohalobius crimeensis TaxID=244365 RepID=UPI00040F8302|nr:hypothetical protein [Methylohalobius crimeensis]
MLRTAGWGLLLLMPLRAVAWEDDAVLSFISRANPILQAQRHVTQAYAKPGGRGQV